MYFDDELFSDGEQLRIKLKKKKKKFKHENVMYNGKNIALGENDFSYRIFSSYCWRQNVHKVTKALFDNLIVSSSPLRGKSSISSSNPLIRRLSNSFYRLYLRKFSYSRSFCIKKEKNFMWSIRVIQKKKTRARKEKLT